jgi:3-deoxy-D-manno-octulosonic acid kinase
MNPITAINKPCAFIYDGDYIQAPAERFFDPAWWERAGAVEGRAVGRGSTLFLDTPFGPAVLRPYLRGGWPARLSRESYLFTGLRRSRPFREFNLLARLSARGLPVPRPLAALCRRGGLAYTGALLMHRLTGVEPLSDLLGTIQAGDARWTAIGACIRRFHLAGVRHADLNARNILVRSATGEVFLVDFDRSCFTPGSAVDGQANLARLRRSLDKIWPPGIANSADACWQALLGGYRA